MRWYRAFRMSDDGTTVTMKEGVTFGFGATAATNTLTTDQKGIAAYFDTAATSGTTYGEYVRLDSSGVGIEAIAGRHKVLLSAAAADAHGEHATVEVNSTSYVTGLCTGVRGNIVFTTDTVVPQGTYYGVMAELYAAGNTSALPASNACLCCSVPTGTAINDVANAIEFSGADGTGHMIYTASDTHQTFVGSIRITVNGVVRYLHFADNQSATS